MLLPPPEAGPAAAGGLRAAAAADGESISAGNGIMVPLDGSELKALPGLLPARLPDMLPGREPPKASSPSFSDPPSFRVDEEVELGRAADASTIEGPGASSGRRVMLLALFMLLEAEPGLDGVPGLAPNAATGSILSRRRLAAGALLVHCLHHWY